MEAIVVIGILIFIIITLIMVAIMQINMAGIEVKDFWSFIKANEEYVFSCAKSLPKNTSFWSEPKVIVPTLWLIPYFVTIEFAIFVALSISLLAPVDISSNINSSEALPPNSDIICSIISVLDINDLSSVG